MGTYDTRGGDARHDPMCDYNPPEPEIVGTCERCQGDVDSEEAHWIGGDLFCDQCAWWVREGVAAMDAKETNK